MMVVSEFLAALGLKDNFSGPFSKTLKKGEQFLQKFKAVTAKTFIAAGAAVTGFLVATGVGIHKFSQKMLIFHDEVNLLAKDLAISRDEAAATKSAMEAMGKSLDEINADTGLREQFEQLKKTALEIQPPDMSKGIEQIRLLNADFTSLKQTVSIGIQWIGHFFFKHVQKPITDFRNMLKGFNERLIKAMPIITEHIGKILAWAVRLITRVIQGGKVIWDVVAKLLDMIPDKLKLVGLALLGLNHLIKTGPFGVLVTLIGVALLLLDDFFTYLEGGESLLGGMWEKLIGFYNQLKDSGVFDKLKAAAFKAFQAVSDGLTRAGQFLHELYQTFKESGSIDAFKKLLTGLKDLLVTVSGIFISLGRKVLKAFTGTGKDALNWFVSEALPRLIEFVAGAVEKADKLVGKLNDMGLAEPIIIGIIAAFAGLKLIDGVTSSVTSLTGVLNGLSKTPGRIKRLKTAVLGIKAAFIGLKGAIMSTKAAQLAQAAATKIVTAAQWLWNAALSANPIGLIIIGIAALIAIVVLLVKNWDKVKEFFIKLWAKIKETFAGIGEWFGEKFTQAREAVTAAFATVGEWFGEKVDAIKNFFLSLPDTAKEAISNVVSTIKNVFSPIVDWFKGKIDAIKGFFGGIADGVKGAASKVSGLVSGDGGDKTGHADGGIFDKEHTARFSEDNKAEAIVPLTKPKRAAEVLAGIGKYLGVSGDQGSVDFTPILNGLATFTQTITSAMNNMNTIMAQNAAVAAAPGGGVVNNYYNQKYDMPVSTKVYTSSDKPQEVASAVDRTQQMAIRNLKGVTV